MLLSKGLNSNYWGTYEFNNILAKIYRESNNDLNQIYQQLYYLNTRVEALIPLLKQDLNSLFESNKRDINSSIETLRSIYPIYPGTIQNEDYPFIKIPSIKVVLQPIGSFFINQELIQQFLCDDASLYCAWGDFDIFQPLDIHSSQINHQAIHSYVINICSEFSALKDKVEIVRNTLSKYKDLDNCKIVFKPTSLQKNTRFL